MRKIALILAATAVLATGPALQARERLSPEQRLDKLLAGREAGRPTSCISSFDTRDMTLLDKTALVFGRGNTIWVNIPRNAQDLDDDDILVTHSFTSELCRLDIVRTVDRNAGFQTGFLALGDFVPYRKVKTGSAY